MKAAGGLPSTHNFDERMVHRKFSVTGRQPPHLNRHNRKEMAGKILIVEDNARLAESLAICLNEAGYETLWAENSARGINTALNERPDLILTDLNLPDMIAIDAMTILKNDPGTSAIPIVVLTAETAGQWKSKALKAGAAEYLLKPISPGDLVNVARKFCPPPSHLF